MVTKEGVINYGVTDISSFPPEQQFSGNEWTGHFDILSTHIM